MRLQTISLNEVGYLPDPTTNPDLLPHFLQQSDNSLRMRHLKLALNQAVNETLSDTQRLYVRGYYWDGLTKQEIATRNGVAGSTVSRTIATALRKIEEYVTSYMRIFDQVYSEIQQWEEERNGQ